MSAHLVEIEVEKEEVARRYGITDKLVRGHLVSGSIYDGGIVEVRNEFGCKLNLHTIALTKKSLREVE